MVDFTTLVSALSRLREGKVSSRDLIRCALDAVKRHNKHCNAMARVASVQELEEKAAQADERYRAKTFRALEGIPVTVKDNILVSGSPLTCGSRVLKGYVPPYTATSAQRLLDAGAILIGSTNMDEFGMGSWCRNSALGPVRQVNGGSSPGGSSGGAAVSLQAKMCLAALASDTGGSVRLPAAMCSLVGFKPTYGAISRYGLVAYASSMDTIGILANSVEDVGAMYSVLSCAQDPRDPATLAYKQTRSEKDLGVRMLNFDECGVSLEQQAHLELVLRQAGVEYTRPDAVEIKSALFSGDYAFLWRAANKAYYVIACAEAASNLARYDGRKKGVSSWQTHLGHIAKARVELGWHLLETKLRLEKAKHVRMQVKETLQSELKASSALVTVFAPKEPTQKESGMLEEDLVDKHTVPASLAGLPSAVVPLQRDKGTPLSVQVIGRQGADLHVLQLARRIEEAVSKLQSSSLAQASAIPKHYERQNPI